MEKRKLNDQEALYERQVNFFDGLPYDERDFTKDFEILSDKEKAALQQYFLDATKKENDVFEYRRQLLELDPEIQDTATKAFSRLLEHWSDFFDKAPEKHRDLLDPSYRASHQ